MQAGIGGELDDGFQVKSMKSKPKMCSPREIVWQPWLQTEYLVKAEVQSTSKTNAQGQSVLTAWETEQKRQEEV